MEIKFNFNSQICTDKNQSERLLALGLKKETADCNLTNYSLKGKSYQDGWQIGTVPYCKVLEEWNKFAKDSCWELIPAWSLHRLLKIVQPMMENQNEVTIPFDNVFEQIIECIEWLIKERYFNKEYLEE